MKNIFIKTILSLIVSFFLYGCGESENIDRYTTTVETGNIDEVQNSNQTILAPVESTFKEDIKMYDIGEVTLQKVIKKSYSMDSDYGSDDDSGKDEGSSEESEEDEDEDDDNDNSSSNSYEGDSDYDSDEASSDSDDRENDDRDDDRDDEDEDEDEESSDDGDTATVKEVIEPLEPMSDYNILGQMDVTLNHKNYNFSVAKYNYGNQVMGPTLNKQSNGKVNLSMTGYFIEDDNLDIEYGTFSIVINNIDLNVNSDYYKVESNILTNSAQEDVYAYVVVSKNGDNIRVIVTVQEFMVFNRDKTQSYEAKFNITAQTN